MLRSRFLKQPANIKKVWKTPVRNVADWCKHFEPKELKWQWEVRESPFIHCPNLCVSRKCPKRSFFPRLRKVYRPVDLESCPPEPGIGVKKPWLDILFELLGWKKEKVKKDPTLAFCSKDGTVAPVKGDPGAGAAKSQQASSQVIPASTAKPQDEKAKFKRKPKTRYSNRLPYEEFRLDRLRTQMEVEDLCRSEPRCFISCQPSSGRTTCSTFAEFKLLDCPERLLRRYQNVELIRDCSKPRPVTSPIGLSDARPLPGKNKSRSYATLASRRPPTNPFKVQKRGLHSCSKEKWLEELSLKPTGEMKFRQNEDFLSSLQPSITCNSYGKFLGQLETWSLRSGKYTFRDTAPVRYSMRYSTQFDESKNLDWESKPAERSTGEIQPCMTKKRRILEVNHDKGQSRFYTSSRYGSDFPGTACPKKPKIPCSGRAKREAKRTRNCDERPLKCKTSVSKRCPGPETVKCPTPESFERSLREPSNPYLDNRSSSASPCLGRRPKKGEPKTKC